MRSLKYIPPPRGIDKMSLATAIDSFLATLAALGLSEKTLKAYRAALRSFADSAGWDRQVTSITLDDYIEWLSKLKRKSGSSGVSSATAHYYSVFVRRFLKWIGLREDIPIVPRARGELIDALTWEEVERLIGAARDYVDLIAVSLMVESGLRASELLALRVADIDLAGGTARVTGKYGKQRIVILGPLSRAILADYIARARLNPGDRLINITYQALYKRLKRLARVAGLNPARIRPHILRHTFATEALRRGMSLPALQKLLGHSDLKITQVYLHLTGEDVRREYERAFLQQNPMLHYYQPYISYPHQIPYLGYAVPSITHGTPRAPRYR